MNYKIIKIKKQETYDWILNKHYAKRIPSISIAFGLYDYNILKGILTIGKPASPQLCDGVCGKEFSKYVYELNRLCINEGLQKNALSYFVGNVLKSIKDNMILISYADTKWGHIGYIYQATNWLYTGITKERTDIGNEYNKHSRHYDKNLNYSINRKFRSSKHRYIYFLGKRKNEFKEKLNYQIYKYPKGNLKRYNSNYLPIVQQILF